MKQITQMEDDQIPRLFKIEDIQRWTITNNKRWPQNWRCPKQRRWPRIEDDQHWKMTYNKRISKVRRNPMKDDQNWNGAPTEDDHQSEKTET